MGIFRFFHEAQRGFEILGTGSSLGLIAQIPGTVGY
jgi:hypothetical protein